MVGNARIVNRKEIATFMSGMTLVERKVRLPGNMGGK